MRHSWSFVSLSSTLNVARLLTLSAALCAVTAHANEIDEINQLLKSGKQTQALTKVEQALSAKPRDPQMRFLKGVIQTELGKPTDAIGTFTKLTEDYPELPEPYNNLAVLYASSAQFDKARAALEMAIRTNPSYSTAHENLGDIYANLASQAYSKALQLGGSSNSLQPKLTLIRELFSPTAKGQSPTASTIKTAPTPQAVTPATAAAPVAAVKAPVPVTATPAVVSTKPVVETAIDESSKQIDQAVLAWAAAWSNKNMSGYLGSYAKGFVPPKGQSRGAWEQDRRARIVGKSRISVKLSNIKASVNGNNATVKFRQDYDAGALSTSSLKTLEMTKAGERWLITKESTGG